MFAQLARMEAHCQQDKPQFRCQTSDVSTAISDGSRSPNEPCMDSSDSEVEEGDITFSRVREYLTRGAWDGSRGDSYKLHAGKAEGVWTCWRQDSCGTSKSFTISYDWEYDLIWWGTTGTYFASAAQIVEAPWELNWYVSKDVNMSKPKFSWRAQADSDAARLSAFSTHNRRGCEHGKPKAPRRSLAQNARRKM